MLKWYIGKLFPKPIQSSNFYHHYLSMWWQIKQSTHVYVILGIYVKPLQHYVISARLLARWVYYLWTDLI